MRMRFMRRMWRVIALTESFGTRGYLPGAMQGLITRRQIMTYRITGLSPEPFAALFALDDASLAERNARRVTAAADRGYPCRVSLRDADKDEQLILLHHTSHDVAPPYRPAYATSEIGNAGGK